MTAYPIYTIVGDSVEQGATLDDLHIKSAGVRIPAITIGEEGRGRARGVIPVEGHHREPLPCPHRGQEWAGFAHSGHAPQPRPPCADCGAEIEIHAGPSTPAMGGTPLTYRHPDAGDVAPPVNHVRFAGVGRTRSGRPKLLAAQHATISESALLVLRTPIGFRGGNRHTGDCTGWVCVCGATGGTYELPSKCPGCDAPRPMYRGDPGPSRQFADMPGEQIAKGTIAQGLAGRAGHGTQMVLILPAGEWVRTVQTGRLYGREGTHYLCWDGERMLVLTPDERSILRG